MGEGLDGWPVVDEVVCGASAWLVVGEDEGVGDGQEEEGGDDEGPFGGRFGWGWVGRHW